MFQAGRFFEEAAGALVEGKAGGSGFGAAGVTGEQWAAEAELEVADAFGEGGLGDAEGGGGLAEVAFFCEGDEGVHLIESHNLRLSEERL